MAQPTYARVGKSFYIYSGGKWNPYQLKNPANAGKIKGFKSLNSASQYYSLSGAPTMAPAAAAPPPPLDYRAQAEGIYNPIYAPQEQQINTLYDTSQQDLQRNLQLEYARRGILSSGLYGEAYGKGQTALATQKTGDLAKLLGEKTGAINKYVSDQQQAEADRQLAEQKAASEAADRAFKQKLQQLQLRRAGVGLQTAQTKAITTGRKLATGKKGAGKGAKSGTAGVSGSDVNAYTQAYLAGDIKITSIPAKYRASVLARAKGKKPTSGDDEAQQAKFVSYADTIKAGLRSGKYNWGSAFRAMRAKFPAKKGEDSKKIDQAIDNILNKGFWSKRGAKNRFDITRKEKW